MHIWMTMDGQRSSVFCTRGRVIPMNPPHVDPGFFILMTQKPIPAHDNGINTVISKK